MNRLVKYRHWMSDSTSWLALQLILTFVITFGSAGNIDHVLQIKDVFLIHPLMVEMVQKMIRIFFRHLQQHGFEFFQGMVSHGVLPLN